jgi:TIR domain
MPPTDTDAELTRADRRIDRFVSRFGYPEGYRRLAEHAALPLVLTPELLHYLRNAFLRGEVPWVSEADLLLSDLCDEVGYEQYVMDPPVRARLVAALRDRNEGRLKEVARLVAQYLRRFEKTTLPLGRDSLQAQQWSALAYLESERVAAEIASKLRDALTRRSDRETLASLASITATLSAQLAAFPNLIDYAGQLSRLLSGESDASTATTGSAVVVNHVSLPAIATVAETLSGQAGPTRAETRAQQLVSKLGVAREALKQAHTKQLERSRRSKSKDVSSISREIDALEDHIAKLEAELDSLAPPEVLRRLLISLRQNLKNSASRVESQAEDLELLDQIATLHQELKLLDDRQPVPGPAIYFETIVEFARQLAEKQDRLLYFQHMISGPGGPNKELRIAEIKTEIRKLQDGLDSLGPPYRVLRAVIDAYHDIWIQMGDSASNETKSLWSDARLVNVLLTEAERIGYAVSPGGASVGLRDVNLCAGPDGTKQAGILGKALVDLSLFPRFTMLPPVMTRSSTLFSPTSWEGRLIILFVTSDIASLWQQRDTLFALSDHVPILMIRLKEDVPPDAESHHLGQLVWLDAVSSPFESHVPDIVNKARRLLTQPRPSQHTEATSGAVDEVSVSPTSILQSATPTFEPPRDIEVFIAHVNQDRDAALLIKLALARENIRAISFLDLSQPQSLTQPEIDGWIMTAQVFIVLISNPSMKSEWVLHELDLAALERIPIMGIRLEDVRTPQSYPRSFKFHLLIDAFPSSITDHLPRIVEAVRSTLSRFEDEAMKIFGMAAVGRSWRWCQTGIQRLRALGRIELTNGTPVGSGMLLQSAELGLDEHEDEFVFLTIPNAVGKVGISSPTLRRRFQGRVAPEDRFATFGKVGDYHATLRVLLREREKRSLSFHVKSGVGSDYLLLRVNGELPGIEPLPISQEAPTLGGGTTGYLAGYTHDGTLKFGVTQVSGEPVKGAGRFPPYAGEEVKDPDRLMFYEIDPDLVAFGGALFNESWELIAMQSADVALGPASSAEPPDYVANNAAVRIRAIMDDLSSS